jgi:hypothetical protein
MCSLRYNNLVHRKYDTQGLETIWVIILQCGNLQMDLVDPVERLRESPFMAPPSPGRCNGFLGQVRRGIEITNDVDHDIRLISVDIYPQHLKIGNTQSETFLLAGLSSEAWGRLQSTVLFAQQLSV